METQRTATLSPSFSSTPLTNQWWTGQLPEHNAETTFVSDIDWRYTCVEREARDILLDFPDADQHGNSGRQRCHWKSWNNAPDHKACLPHTNTNTPTQAITSTSASVWPDPQHCDVITSNHTYQHFCLTPVLWHHHKQPHLPALLSDLTPSTATSSQAITPTGTSVWPDPQHWDIIARNHTYQHFCLTL